MTMTTRERAMTMIEMQIVLFNILIDAVAVAISIKIHSIATRHSGSVGEIKVRADDELPFER